MNQIYEQNAPWELIGKKLAGELSVSEAQELQDWIDADATHLKIWNQAEFVWKESKQLDHHFEKDIDESKAWAKLSKHLGFETPETKTIELSFWQRYGRAAVAVAAVFLVATLSYYWILPQINGQQQEEIQWLAVENELDVPKTVQMPDGSTIVLNKNTKLQYPDKFDQRMVKLEGEAYFEVEHDETAPFIIQLGEEGKEKVEVLGTSFNIRAYPNQNEIEVAVLSGKVRFETETKKQQLKKGEAALFQKKEDQMSLMQRPNATSWKSKSFEFNDQPLSSIEKELERHFNVEIEFVNKGTQNCVFKAKYEKADLNRILQEMAFGLELEIEEKDGVIYLNGAPCQGE